MVVPARPTSGAPIETSWGDAAHDTIVAQDLQGAIVDVTLANTANNDRAIVFPRPFASAPAVVVSGDTVIYGALVAKVIGTTITTTGFTLRVGAVDGVGHGTGTFRCSWMAYGPRA